MKKFNVGLQLYTVRGAMAADFEGTIKAVAEMGYEYVEFAGFFGKSAEEVKSILDKYGLKCVSAHYGMDEYYNIVKDPEATVAYLNTIGIKYYVLAWYDVNKLAGSPEWETTLAQMKEVSSILASNGIKFGYHNHDFEFRVVDGKYIHDHIFDSIPKDEIEPEIDTCWVRYADIDPAEKIREFAGRVHVVHLKDFVCSKFGGGPVYELIGDESKKEEEKEENFFEFRPVGYGVQDFASILAACEECGTETVIVEQDKTYDLPELEAARRSREYLKNTFGI